MRTLILFLITVMLATAAKANELVVGEQGSVRITLPDQPNNQKCNIEVKFADGSSQDIEVDPKKLSASVSFTPTVAGAQLIQWDGKMKWRGLKSRPPCEGDGNVSVTVRERAEVLAEREAKAKLERNRQTIASLIAQIDTEDKKQCALMWIKVKYGNPEQYGITDAQNIASKLMDRYVNGDNSMAVTSETVTGVKRMLNTCNQFFAIERQWDSQTFEPPPGDISCELQSGAESTCFWTYAIYVNDTWQNATAMQAMEAHITSGEKFWDTALPEKPDAKALREKCEQNVLSDEGCPGYAEAVAKKKQEAKLKAEEEARLARCGTEPLVSTKCPGYKQAKAKQDAELARQRAKEEKRKEEKLARQRAEEQEKRVAAAGKNVKLPRTQNMMSNNDRDFGAGRCFASLDDRLKRGIVGKGHFGFVQREWARLEPVIPIGERCAAQAWVKNTVITIIEQRFFKCTSEAKVSMPDAKTIWGYYYGTEQIQQSRHLSDLEKDIFFLGTCGTFIDLDEFR